MGIGEFFERLFAGRWIAGPGLSDAITLCKRFNNAGISGMINYMGEYLQTDAQIDEAVNTYLSLISEIKRNNAKASVSLKVTQLGLDIKTAEKNYLKVISAARKAKIFVWMDMESNKLVDETITVYLKYSKGGGTGICIQAYLRRSEADIKRIVKAGGTIRLVKGAYSESSDVAFSDRREITDNYATLMRYLFAKSKWFAVATHDPKMILLAKQLSKSTGKKPEFCMLNGIRNIYAKELVAEGRSVSLYIPFGKAWMEYSFRRLKELSNMKLIIRSMFENQSV